MLAAGEESGAVTIYHGEEMGFPSTIDLRWTAERARLGGLTTYHESRTVSR